MNELSELSISVIIPVYGVEKYLPACLDTLDKQTFQDFETILVDDGSPDMCGVICDQWAASHPHAVVIHQPNQGLSAARNMGINAAHGRYLSFIDSDDLLCPTFLEVLYNACEQNNADLSLCGVEDIDEAGRSLESPKYALPHSGCFSGKELLNNFYSFGALSYTVAWNKLYRAELWKNLRYPVGKLHEDDAVAHRIFFSAARVVCISQPLYQYRLRAGSICRTQICPGHFDGVDALIDRYFFYRKNRIKADLTSRACWQQYLYLCGKAANSPSSALVERIRSLQPVLRSIPMTGLSPMDKLIAIKWSYIKPNHLLKTDDYVKGELL